MVLHPKDKTPKAELKHPVVFFVKLETPKELLESPVVLALIEL